MSKWSEESFVDFLRSFRECVNAPEWIVAPDVVGNGKQTLRDWKYWHKRIKDICNEWRVALAVQDGMVLQDVIDLEPTPDVIFVGGTDDWTWRTAKTWCDNFTHVHIGKVGTVKRLWIA